LGEGAYQGNDFHEAPKGEEDSEEHFGWFGSFCDDGEVGCDVLVMIFEALAGKSQCDKCWLAVFTPMDGWMQ
jgi:hypothetical protein